MNPDPLTPKVRGLFANLTHAGDVGVDDAQRGDLLTVYGEAGREQRGTRVRFTLRVRHGELMEVRYQTYGCPHTLAVCEWLAQELEAGRLASIGRPEDWCRTLAVPIVKLGRLLVVEDALSEALRAAAQKGADVSKNVVK